MLLSDLLWHLSESNTHFLKDITLYYQKWYVNNVFQRGWSCFTNLITATHVLIKQVQKMTD